jgi:16S rRNA processing protein RimM
MTVAAAPLVAVGEVLKPHGLTGEVKVRSLSDRTEDRFRRLRECILWEPQTDRREACRIASCRLEGETVLVRIEGIDSPEAARRLSGRLLAVDRAEVLPPPDGSFYPWQLHGARVETRDGRQAGTFVRVEPGGGQDLWVIAHEGRERLIPAVAEIVIDVSVADRRIVIDPPEGLLDL